MTLLDKLLLIPTGVYTVEQFVYSLDLLLRSGVRPEHYMTFTEILPPPINITVIGCNKTYHCFCFNCYDQTVRLHVDGTLIPDYLLNFLHVITANATRKT